MKTKNYLYICDICGAELEGNSDLDSIECNKCHRVINTNQHQWSKNHINFDKNNRKINHKQNFLYALIIAACLLFTIRLYIRREIRTNLENSRKNGEKIIDILNGTDKKEDIVE